MIWSNFGYGDIITFFMIFTIILIFKKIEMIKLEYTFHRRQSRAIQSAIQNNA